MTNPIPIDPVVERRCRKHEPVPYGNLLEALAMSAKADNREGRE